MSNSVFIDEKDVPPRKTNISKWEETFASVPSGKALVLEMDCGPIRQALVQLKAKGKFLNYTVTQKGRKAYIINSKQLRRKRNKHN